MDITCPSGLKGTLKKPKVRVMNEMRKIANQHRIKSFTYLLSQCWAKTIDPGIYRYEGDEVPWREVISGDRFYILLMIRQLLYGPNYEFPVRCANCGKKFGWVLELDKLEVDLLSDEAKQVMLTDEKLFDGETEDGLPFRFRIATGRIEEEVDEGDDEEELLQFVMPRLFSLGDVTQRPLLREALLDLDQDVFDEIQAAIKAVDCGVETEIEVYHSACKRHQAISLPFDRRFFFPKSAA